MIRVIRMDGTELMLNDDLIRQVEKQEKGEGTVITLQGGEKIEVKNPPIDVQIKAYARRVGMEEESRRKDEVEVAEEKEEPREAKDSRRFTRPPRRPMVPGKDGYGGGDRGAGR